MRISTSMIFSQGTATIQQKTADLLKVQQQLSTGKKILTPADDPVGAAQALEVTQAQSINTQFMSNQATAKDILSTTDGQLSSIDDLLASLESTAVQLGDASLTSADKDVIATQLRSDYSQLLGYANAQDGSGNYLFSGYSGSTQPFTGTVDTGVSYNGDSGQRTLQVSTSRFIPVSDSGSSIFLAATDDSVPFAVSASTLNSGTATAASPTVTDSTKWNSSLNGKNYTIKFAVDSTTGTTTYDIVDDTGMSLLTNSKALNTVPLPATYQSGTAISLATISHSVLSASAATTNTGTAQIASSDFTNRSTWDSGDKNYSINFTSATAYTIVDNTTSTTIGSGTYTAGTPIAVNGAELTLSGTPASGDSFSLTSSTSTSGQDLGATVTISGAPKNGDSFSIKSSSTTSIFDTLSSLIKAAEATTSSTTTGNTALSTAVTAAIANIQSAQNTLLKVRSSVGARLDEISSLSDASSARDTEYADRLSSLQDVDYTSAITSLNQNQLNLQAAQESFSKISQLSLFNYLS